MSETIKILFLSTGSPDGSGWPPGRETREISERLLAGSQRDCFDLISEFAVKVKALQRLLLWHEPHVVHFSNRHNAGQGVALVDDAERPQLVDPKALADLFKLLRDNIRVVIVNACYDDSQARELAQTIDYTIWVSSELDEGAAISFSAHFYQALAFGRSVRTAFDLAVNQLTLECGARFVTPKLWVRPGVDDSQPLNTRESTQRAGGSLKPSPRAESEQAGAHAGQQIREGSAVMYQPLSGAGAAEQALAQLRMASRIVEADAKVVVHDEALGGDVCLDQNLYVRRNVEQKLARHVNEAGEEAVVVLLVGEAGRGKTSLLWSLYRSLSRNDSLEVWFIKSTLLADASPPNPRSADASPGPLSALTFSRALSQIEAFGKRPVLLLDTIDLLLHDEASRNVLLTLLFNLLERRCTIVATCRPQEVPRLNPIEFTRVTLIDYEGAELEEAIRKHVARFYAPSIQRSETDYAAAILEAVARGLPIREVCANPLTLRMLFTIYAPSEIPNDINVFELYKEYWDSRVERDYRAGNPFPLDDTPNLENTASAVALCMLIKGAPEVGIRQLQRAARYLGVSRGEVEGLISRGVLHASESGAISFFHQTFFEHSAARGIIKHLGIDSLSVLEERSTSNATDLFTSPIYEQALLLAEDEPQSLRARSDRAIVSLFEKADISSVMSALYVYCHRKDVPDAVEEAARGRLSQADEAVRNRFLELAPNTPTHRLENLMRELDTIWGTATSRIREHLVHLLKRLVPRAPGRVSEFVDRNNLIDYAFEIDSLNVARKLLETIEGLAAYDPAWAWERLMTFCRIATFKTKGRELQVALIKFLAQRADLFDPRSVAARFEADTAGVTLDQARDFNELSDACGELWLIQWRAGNSSVPDILTEISMLPEGMSVITRMKGLGLLLRSVSVSEAAFAFSTFLREERSYHRAWWANTVIPLWLRGLDCSGEGDGGSVGFVQRAIQQMLTEGGEDWANKNIKHLLVQVLRKAELSPNSFTRVLGADSFGSPAHWLAEDKLAYLLADGYVAKHPGAIEAMELLRKHPQAYWGRISKAVGPRVVRRVAASPDVMDVFFEITLEVEDAHLIQRALEQLPNPVPEALYKWGERLNHFCQRLMNSEANPQKRRYAIMIWEHLLKLGFKPIHRLEELTALLNKVGDTRIRGYLISIIGHSAAAMHYDFRDVVRLLKPYATSTDVELRRRGMFALARAAAESRDDVAKYASTVLDIALDPPINAERLTALRRMLEGLVPIHTELAATLVKKLILGALTGGLGVSGRHKLFGRLKPTIRLIVRFSSAAARNELIEMVPQLDRVLGSLVIDAICHEALFESQAALNLLLESTLPGEIKEIILKYRYTQERSLGGRGWPELEELLGFNTRSSV
jgi:hypothetical protein